jgi:hypothetical protein
MNILSSLGRSVNCVWGLLFLVGVWLVLRPWFRRLVMGTVPTLFRMLPMMPALNELPTFFLGPG